jgi:hypothetical protein
MQNAAEAGHQVDPGAGKSLEWHHGDETAQEARTRMHDEPIDTIRHLPEMTMEYIREHYLTAKGLGHHVLDHAAEEGVKELAKAYLPRIAASSDVLTSFLAGEGAPIVAGTAIAAAEVKHAFTQADELRHRADVEALDVATTALLDLDGGFRAEEAAKHFGINAEKTVAVFVDSYNKPTAFGRDHLPELQAAADAGSTAALLALKMGGAGAYFAQNPAAKARYNDDIAFSKGFDNAIYIASHDHAEEKLKALEAKLAERNAWLSTSRPVQG